MPRINVLPHPLTTVSTRAVVPLGSTFYDYEGRGYVFWYNAGAGTTAVGDVIGVYSTFTYGYGSVTAGTIIDITDGTTIRPKVVGVALSVVATTQYGWAWFYGKGTHAITTDGNVVANDMLSIADGAIVATRDVSQATGHRNFGVAYATDSGTTLSLTELGGDQIFNW